MIEQTPDEQLVQALRDRIRSPIGGQAPTVAGDQVYYWSMYPIKPEENQVQIDVRDSDESMDSEFGYSPEGLNRHFLQVTALVSSKGREAPALVKTGMSQIKRLLDWDNQLGGLTEWMALEARTMAQAEEDALILYGWQLWTITYYTKPIESHSPFPPHRILVNIQEPFGREAESDYADILGLNQ